MVYPLVQYRGPAYPDLPQPTSPASSGELTAYRPTPKQRTREVAGGGVREAPAHDGFCAATDAHRPRPFPDSCRLNQ
jgi:hypothetical protein